jgi:hypothetical protein
MSHEFFSNDFVSRYHVYEFIRFICENEFPEVYKILTDLYSQSVGYVLKVIDFKRHEISMGHPTTSLEMDVMEKSVRQSDCEACWGTFFVFAAKVNKQSDRKLLNLFQLAWSSNAKNISRWKLLDKMAQRGLLLHEEVLFRIIESDVLKDWDVFIEWISKSCYMEEFMLKYKSMAPGEIEGHLAHRHGEGWKRIKMCIGLASNGIPYPRGGDAMDQHHSD